MSHEIRTPINGILGMNELLLESELDNRQRHFAQLVKMSSQSLLHLINDILDFSKIEAGKLEIRPQDIDLYQFSSEIVDSLAIRAQDKQLELVLDLAPDLPRWVNIDPDRVKQVLNNLLSNAIKFTTQGEVVLQVRQDSTEELNFKVIDTGQGIPKGKQKYLFSKFMQVDGSSTRKFGGTGLGLAISKQLCEMMGGKISVQSTELQGSTFSFNVKTKIVESAVSSRERETHLVLPAKRLLIVDSHPSVQAAVRHFLAQQNIDIQTANQAPEAIKILRNAADSAQPFDCILVDLALPGMNGIEFIKVLHHDSRLKPLQVILMTNQAWTAEAHPPTNGVTGYLAKPLTPAALFSALTPSDTNKITSNISQDGVSNAPSSAGRAALNILLVEDNYINQQVVIGMLDNLNCSYHLAKNGVEALKALKNSQNSFDLILMDCQMPLMDGYEATKQIRTTSHPAFDCAIPIIALTANAMKGDAQKCLDAGMNDYLAKPVLSNQLAETIRSWGNSHIVDTKQNTR